MTSSIDRRVWPDFGSRRSIPRSQPSPSPSNPAWGHHGAMHTDPSARTPSISRPAPHVNQIPLEPNPTLYTGWNAMGAQVHLPSGMNTNAIVFSSFHILFFNLQSTEEIHTCGGSPRSSLVPQVLDSTGVASLCLKLAWIFCAPFEGPIGLHTLEFVKIPKFLLQNC